jgi:hypothetical protein
MLSYFKASAEISSALIFTLENLAKEMAMHPLPVPMSNPFLKSPSRIHRISSSVSGRGIKQAGLT